MRATGLFVAAVLAGLGAGGRAGAAVIFSDNFDAETAGLNLTPTNFTIVNGGTVDIIGTGFFDLIPGNGLYIDLDGSSGLAGAMRSNPGLIPLVPGTYALTFDLAGSHRGNSTETVTVDVGTAVDPTAFGSQVYVVTGGEPFTTRTIVFAVAANTDLLVTFTNAGGDNEGALLDNVQVADFAPNAVPEPASLALVGAGAVGLLGGRRLRRRAA